jgi:phosphopantothenoylcysteine decarboxylase/phosphopantothenate--cysteine ligase
MDALANRNVLLGITGGIAAYKAAELTRLLVTGGARVRVAMTPAAQTFVTPLTLQALSGNPVHTELLDSAAEAAMGHIELARWADVVLVAPATADFIARLAHGHANDLLSTLCLATRAPLALAPAMNTQMWLHPATQANCEQLAARGVTLLGPGAGDLACGETGGPHARAGRPGALPGQPQLGQDGVRGRAGGVPCRCQRHAGRRPGRAADAVRRATCRR